MSSDTTDTTEEPLDDRPHGSEDERRELTGDEFLDRERGLREQRKEFVLEYPDGAVAVFEYKMLDERTLDRIEDDCTNIRQRRGGGDPDVDIDRKTFRTKLIMEATTRAPEGFKLTERQVEQLSRDTREAYADAIENFSTAPEEVRKSFR